MNQILIAPNSKLEFLYLWIDLGDVTSPGALRSENDLRNWVNNLHSRRAPNDASRLKASNYAQIARHRLGLFHRSPLSISSGWLSIESARSLKCANFAFVRRMLRRREEVFQALPVTFPTDKPIVYAQSINSLTGKWFRGLFAICVCYLCAHCCDSLAFSAFDYGFPFKPRNAFFDFKTIFISSFVRALPFRKGRLRNNCNQVS